MRALQTSIGDLVGRGSQKRRLYADCNASTPELPAVTSAMAEASRLTSGANPASRHDDGRAAGRLVQRARAAVARLLGVESPHVVFTSSATESLNLAIRGTLGRLHTGQPLHVVACAVEHKAVLSTLEDLEGQGIAEVDLAPVDHYGRVRLAALSRLIRRDTALVAVQSANNEVGALHPIGGIARGLSGHPAVFLVDATQSAGLLPTRAADRGIDLVAISGHKLHGPKGIGALYVGRGPTSLRPLATGGGQEGGLRPGTVPVPLCVGLGVAADLARADFGDRARTLRQRAAHVLAGLQPLGARLIGPPVAERLPGNLSLLLPGPAELVLGRLSGHGGVAISRGSACGCGRPSHVLQALGLSPELQKRVIRVGLGVHLSADDVVEVRRRLQAAIVGAR